MQDFSDWEFIDEEDSDQEIQEEEIAPSLRQSIPSVEDAMLAEALEENWETELEVYSSMVDAQYPQKEAIINFYTTYLNKKNQNALHVAVCNKSFRWVSFIASIYHGKDHEHSVVELLNQVDRKGNTALHYCVTTANMSAQTVAEILKNTTDSFLTQDREGRTAMHYPAMYHRNDSLREFLSHDTSKRCRATKDNKNMTPIDYAALTGNTKGLELMLKRDQFYKDLQRTQKEKLFFYASYSQDQECLQFVKEAFPRTVMSTLIHQEAKFWNCLHYGVAIERPSSPPHLTYLLSDESVRKLMNSPDMDSRTPTHYCVLNRNHRALLRLVQYGADIFVPDYKGYSPLHYALLDKSNSQAVLRILFSKEDNIAKFRSLSTNNENDVKEDSYLYFVAKRAKENQLAYLLTLLPKEGLQATMSKLLPNRKNLLELTLLNQMKSALSYTLFTFRKECMDFDFESTNSTGQTILHLLAPWSDSDLIKHMLAQGQEASLQKAFDMKDKYGRTATFVAAMKNNIDLVKLIGRNYFEQDNQGNYPLHAAAATNHIQAFLFLYKLYKQQNQEIAMCINHKGESAFHIAAARSAFRIVRYLSENIPGSEFENEIDVPDAKGNRGIMYAATSGKTQTLQILAKQSIGSKNTLGLGVLHCAIAAGGNYHVINWILESGQLDVNNGDLQGRTALHHLCILGTHFEYLSLLLNPKYQVNVNVQDVYGRTALHYAILKKHLVVAQRLIGLTAADIVDVKKRTFAHYAVKSDAIEMVNIVIDRHLPSILHVGDEDGLIPLHYAIRWKLSQMTEFLIPISPINHRTYKNKCAVHFVLKQIIQSAQLDMGMSTLLSQDNFEPIKFLELLLAFDIELKHCILTEEESEILKACALLYAENTDHSQKLKDVEACQKRYRTQPQVQPTVRIEEVTVSHEVGQTQKELQFDVEVKPVIGPNLPPRTNCSIDPLTRSTTYDGDEEITPGNEDDEVVLNEYLLDALGWESNSGAAYYSFPQLFKLGELISQQKPADQIVLYERTHLTYEIRKSILKIGADVLANLIYAGHIPLYGYERDFSELNIIWNSLKSYWQYAPKPSPPKANLLANGPITKLLRTQSHSPAVYSAMHFFFSIGLSKYAPLVFKHELTENDLLGMNELDFVELFPATKHNLRDRKLILYYLEFMLKIRQNRLKNVFPVDNVCECLPCKLNRPSQLQSYLVSSVTPPLVVTSEMSQLIHEYGLCGRTFMLLNQENFLTYLKVNRYHRALWEKHAKFMQEAHKKYQRKIQPSILSKIKRNKFRS